MKTICETTNNTYEIKQSKFIAFLTPFNNLKTLQAKLKITHPKSRHIVVASRYMNDYLQIVESSSDDKEPKGSAGTPCLNVLRGNDLVNCAVLTVRYFGGTRLGVGGLARAYTNAVKNVILVSTIKEYEKEEKYNVKCDYEEIEKVKYCLKKINIENYKIDFQANNVNFNILSDESSIQKLDKILKLKGKNRGK